MTVAMIGSGNVATILCRLITRNNHRIIHIAGRNTAHAEALANEFNASASDVKGVNEVNADICIIAISDAAIPEVVNELRINNKLVLHTAGSVSKDALKNISANYGVLYPLQSLRKEMQEIPEIPFLVDGVDEGVMEYIYSFARSLSGNVQRTNDEDRLKLHAAAVIVNNFTNHLYGLAEEFCKKENVNFDLLKPLIMETAHRILFMSPSAVQTGPAVRKDIHTLDKHLRLFSNYPKLRTTYLRLTDSIMNP
jgi:predicted short-subunit dehydrogenase-like oxidoreductase (DUF2520 family)